MRTSPSQVIGKQEISRWILVGNRYPRFDGRNEQHVENRDGQERIKSESKQPSTKTKWQRKKRQKGNHVTRAKIGGARPVINGCTVTGHKNNVEESHTGDEQSLSAKLLLREHHRQA